MLRFLRKLYSTFVHREVSAVRYNINQITIHPVVAFYTCNNPECDNKTTSVQENIMCITNDLNHDFHAVNHFQKRAVDHLRDNRNIRFQFLKDFTDGCTAQYKSKNTILDLSYCTTDMNAMKERTKNASSHGKSPCDSAGGVLKVAIKRAVIWGKTSVNCAEEMVKYASENLVKESIIQGKCNHNRRIFMLWENIDHTRDDRRSDLAIAGFRKIHNVKVIAPGHVTVRQCSCSCINCQNEDEENCQHGIPPARDTKLGKRSKGHAENKSNKNITSTSKDKSVLELPI